MNWLRLRLLVLAGFVFAMPVFAVPAVNQWVDTQLFGAGPARAAMTSNASAAPASVVEPAAKPTTPPSSPPLSISQAAPLPKPKLRLAVAARHSPSDEPPPAMRMQSPLRRLPPDDIAMDANAYSSIQIRLQNLGATYFMLERSATERDQFRFHCRMALPGSGAYERPFEASDRDPLLAMQRVLTEVETWAASRASGELRR